MLQSLLVEAEGVLGMTVPTFIILVKVCDEVPQLSPQVIYPNLASFQRFLI